MILQALYNLHARLEKEEDYGIAPMGRSPQRITFRVVIEPNGNLVDIQDARIERNGRREPARVFVLGQTKPPGSGLNPCFLWDSTGYLLGWDERPERANRAPESFKAFRDRHLEVEASIRCPTYSAVCRFLERWDPSQAVKFPILQELATGFGVFQIRGMPSYVHEDPVIQEWWDRRTEGDPERMKEWWKAHDEASQEAVVGQCLITGQEAVIARLHTKIKGVRDAQTSGATIAGFNDPAYWSYGLEQSYNAPVSVEAARRYTAALNALLDSPMRKKHRVDVGNTTVVFWTGKQTVIEDIFAQFFQAGSASLESAKGETIRANLEAKYAGETPEFIAAQDETIRAKLEAFLKALRKGGEAFSEFSREFQHTPFFILGLGAPTPARIAVRFFHSCTVSELLAMLYRHHQHIGIARRFADSAKRPEPEFPSVPYLLDSLRPAGNKEDLIPRHLPPAFLEAIVTGNRYPEGLYKAVMRRLVADRNVSYPRACIIKGYLVRNGRKEVSMSLDKSRQDPAYLLGRLFAALEKTQRDALGETVGSTVRDRFYASASATPAVVFPRLLRTYQHHLSKLEGGFKIAREKLVQEILEPIREFPTHLGLEDQGLFAIGYYHQMNDFYHSKSDKNNAPEA